MAHTPSLSRLEEMTALTASHRSVSNHTVFMAQYTWWTARADGLTGVEGATAVPYDPLTEAAQIEALAAARRRNAYRHPAPCYCDACHVVHRYGMERLGRSHLHAA